MAAIQKNIKGLMMVAALGTVLGSISALLYPNREATLSKMRKKAQGFAERGENFFSDLKSLGSEPKRNNTQNFYTGTILGVLLGASSAMLLTPKSGKQFRKNLTQTYQEVADKTQEMMQMMHFNNNHGPHHPMKRKPASKSITAKRKTSHAGLHKAKR